MCSSEFVALNMKRGYFRRTAKITVSTNVAKIAYSLANPIRIVRSKLINIFNIHRN